MGCSACKISGELPEANLALPAIYRGSTENPSDSSGVAQLPAKSFFNDPVLLQLLDSAIAGNLDLQLAIKNIDQAALIFKQSKLGNLPRVDLSLSASSVRQSDNSLNGLNLNQFLGRKRVEDYTASANLSWEADIWGKIRSRKEAAYAEYLQSDEARKAIHTQLVATVSQGYYNLLSLDAQAEIAKKNLALNEKTLLIIKLQYTAGQVSALAVEQAEAQRLTAAQLIPQFEQEILVQENGISILTGKMPMKIVRSKDLGMIRFPSGLSAGLPSKLLQRRPDVRRAELEVMKSHAIVGINRAAMYPSLTITAQGGLNAFMASNWFNVPASLFGSLFGGLSQPLFQRKSLKTQFEISKIDRDKSVIEFRQQVLKAVGEVSDALVKIQKLDEQQSFASSRALVLNKATVNADMLFKNGMANYLEVISAQSNALKTELELALIEKDRLYAVVELYRSTGGGWQ